MPAALRGKYGAFVAEKVAAGGGGGHGPGGGTSAGLAHLGTLRQVRRGRVCGAAMTKCKESFKPHAPCVSATPCCCLLYAYAHDACAVTFTRTCTTVTERPTCMLTCTAMSQAGLNHLHLLPTYDFGSVPERAEEQAQLNIDLSTYPPDSETQQAAVLAIADRDGFNWGYDPVGDVQFVLPRTACTVFTSLYCLFCMVLFDVLYRTVCTAAAGAGVLCGTASCSASRLGVSLRSCCGPTC